MIGKLMRHSIKSQFRYYSTLKFSVSNMNANKCYFTHLQKENEVQISFLFKVQEDNIRQFNFVRKPDDCLSVLRTRIATNIQKVFNKLNKKKKSNKTINEDDIQFYEVGNDIPSNLSCSDLIAKKYPAELKIYEHVYEIIYNPPWIVNITLPHSMLAGFPVCPVNFIVQFADKHHSIFNWYRSESKNEKHNHINEINLKWQFISRGFTYIPTNEDIGKKLKLECIPRNQDQTGPAVDTVSTNLVEAGPGKCPFENRHVFTASKLKNKSFRCLTYNILADLYCDSDFTRTVLHPYCPPYALHIDYRKQLIVKELLGYNADILCLQEVDNKIFNSVLTPILKADGFEGVFSKKGNEVAEGVACFYRSERFRLLSHTSIVLGDAIKNNVCLSTIWNAIKENEPLVERLCNRSTVTSATIIESIENNNEILIVGNTHLYFHPDADHIRLIQGGASIYWLKELFMQTKIQKPTSRVSLILCGDFNSVPTCGIYKLYTEGLAPSELPDWKSNENESVNGLSLIQEIPLASACGTPKYTNFTSGFADCLDYIYYDTNNLTVEQVIPLPSDEELQAHTALPSIVFPSDHIALVSDLMFKT